MRFPATAPLCSQAARQLAQPSLQNSARSGQHRGGLPISRGRGRQVMHLPCKQAHAGALPADSTISGSVAQSEEQPVVCGKAEGASPFGSATFSERSSVFRAPGLGPGGRRWKSCRSDHFTVLPWPNQTRHPSSKHFWKAGRYKLTAPVLKTGSALRRGRSVTDAIRHFETCSRSRTPALPSKSSTTTTARF